MSNIQRWYVAKPDEAAQCGGLCVAIDKDLNLLASGKTVGEVALKLADLKIPPEREPEVCVDPIPEGFEAILRAKSAERFIQMLADLLVNGGRIKSIDPSTWEARVWKPKRG
jgi:hypothetical protein